MNFNLPDSILLHRDLHYLHSYLLASSADNQEIDDIVAGSAQLQALIQANQTVYDSSGLAGIEKSIKSLLKTAPVFDVILATSPHDTFLQELGSWFRSSIHKNSLLKISVRRGIGGGMVLRSKNKIFDFSLRPKILNTKQKIPEVAKRV